MNAASKEKEVASTVSKIYEDIAQLLPVEGRDYILNASDNGNGGVHMEPVAYTIVGKLWLEYLSKTLPEYSSADEETKEKIINRPWNYQKKEEEEI